MKEVICDFCGNKFLRKNSQIINSIKHYCSLECRRRGRKTGDNVKCFYCGKLTYKTQRNLKGSKSGKYFCCQNCCNKWLGEKQNGVNSPNWASGRAIYKKILERSGSDRFCLLCKKDNPRILCAHHLDKNRRNNRVDNLVWLCRNCHHLVHNYEEAAFRLTKKL